MDVQSKSIARVFDHLNTVAPSINFTLSIVTRRLVTGCNPNDLDIWTDWCHLGLQFVVYKSAEQEWSFVN